MNAMLDLLDIAASLTRESHYGQQIQHHFDVAKELFLKTSLFTEKARQYLSFAHRMMTGGKKYELVLAIVTPLSGAPMPAPEGFDLPAAA